MSWVYWSTECVSKHIKFVLTIKQIWIFLGMKYDQIIVKTFLCTVLTRTLWFCALNIIAFQSLLHNFNNKYATKSLNHYLEASYRWMGNQSFCNYCAVTFSDMQWRLCAISKANHHNYLHLLQSNNEDIEQEWLERLEIRGDLSVRMEYLLTLFVYFTIVAVSSSDHWSGKTCCELPLAVQCKNACQRVSIHYL